MPLVLIRPWRPTHSHSSGPRPSLGAPARAGGGTGRSTGPSSSPKTTARTRFPLPRDHDDLEPQVHVADAELGHLGQPAAGVQEHPEDGRVPAILECLARSGLEQLLEHLVRRRSAGGSRSKFGARIPAMGETSSSSSSTQCRKNCWRLLYRTTAVAGEPPVCTRPRESLIFRRVPCSAMKSRMSSRDTSTVRSRPCVGQALGQEPDATARSCRSSSRTCPRPGGCARGLEHSCDGKSADAGSSVVVPCLKLSTVDRCR